MTSSDVKSLSDRMSIWVINNNSGICRACIDSKDGDENKSEACSKPATLVAEIGYCGYKPKHWTNDDCFVKGHPRKESIFTVLCDEHGAIMRSWSALVSIRSIYADA